MTRRESPNRLASEKSPYLLQHAWNPVDWRPWGEEAFEEARRTERPIFLSVGYSTCHWCHVMERESFEDARTAELLNRHFVPIKVDREEMPDLDRLYMLFVQATTGRGGWPMSVWLTPALKPFFGGSYFPPVDRWGLPSFSGVLEVLASMWEHDRERLTASAGSMMQQMLELDRQPAGGGELNRAPATECLGQLERSFDSEFGGFGEAPKFPRPAIFAFLFSQASRSDSRAPLDMALHSLKKIAEGGIHDQLGIQGLGGGGFARYSTDRYWHVPHFEKMLYDNAQLAVSYLQAWQWSREPVFADAARDIFNYVLCDMTSPDGAFFAAEDADSMPSTGGEMKEGAFYLWTKPEVDSLLGPADAGLFCEAYRIRMAGNAPSDPHGEFRNLNILVRSADTDELSKMFSMSPEEVATHLESARAKLYEARSVRPRPLRDDKVITAWNGLMISALAKGSRILDDENLLQAARRAAAWIREKMYTPQSGRLYRRYCGGEASIAGKASDYASLVQGLIDLYEASFEPDHLRLAVKLTETQLSLFYDRQNGGFFSTASDDRLVPARLKESEDGAEPSASSVSALNLFRLAAMTGRDELRRYGEETVRSFSSTLENSPSAMPLMLAALDLVLTPQRIVVLAGDAGDQAFRDLEKAAFRHDHPGTVITHGDTAPEDLMPYASATARAHQGKPAAYLCFEGSCMPPVHEPEALEEMLDE